MFFAVTDPLRVVQRVADHSDQDPIAILLAVVGIAINLGQIRAIGQVLDRLEDQPALRCPRIFTSRDVTSFQWS